MSNVPVQRWWQTELILVRAFLARFFENEVTAGAHDLKASLFWLIALLALPGAVAPMLLGLSSLQTAVGPPDPSTWGWAMVAKYQGVDVLRTISRADKTLYLGFAMIASAMLSAITWSSFLVERRDALVLGLLPVRSSSVVFARLAAIVAYVALASAAMHALASVSFGSFLAAENTLGFALRGMAAHFVASCAASLFVCLVVVAVQGLVLVVVGPRRFTRVSPIMQAVLVAIVVLGLVTLPIVSSSVLDTLAGNGKHAQPWILHTPPLWFLGVYETVLGGADPELQQLAGTAVITIGILLLTILATYPIACYRLLVDAVERSSEFGRVSRWSVLARVIAQASGRASEVRAISQHFLATIARAGRHRFVMAIAVGVAIAWGLPAWMSLATSLPAEPRTDLLSLPIAAMFFVLGGLRIAATLPSDLRASWMFEVYAPSRIEVHQALQRTMFAVAVVPIAMISTGAYWYLWGREVALTHAVCALAVGALLTEVALWRFDIMPCATAWKPPAGHLRKWWPVYLIALSVVTRGIPAIEALVLEHSYLVILFVPWMVGIARLVRTHSLAPRPLGDEESAELVTSALRAARGRGEFRKDERFAAQSQRRSIRDVFRSADGEPWFDEFSLSPAAFWRDLSMGVRRLVQAPVFTVFSIVTLALGIGVTTASYSVMYDFIWRPLGVADSASILTLRHWTSRSFALTTLSWPDFDELHNRQTVFSAVAAAGPTYSSLAANNRAELVTGQAVSGEFFQVFNVRPALGRLIQPDDDRPGGPQVVVLSNTTWRKQLGSDPHIVGQIVKLGDRPFEVIGVAPDTFRGSQPGRQGAFWVPLSVAPVLSSWLGNRTTSTDRLSEWLTVAARLRPGISKAAAEESLKALSGQLDHESPLPASSDAVKSPSGQPVRAWQLMSLYEDPGFKAGSRMGMFIVALPVLVLLVACTNLANLVLSRGISRRHEFAVRRALGASRWGLVRELTVEVGSIALIGGAGGLLVTRVLLTTFVTRVQQTFGYKPAMQIDPHFEPRVFAVAAITVVLALIVAGFMPALQLTSGGQMRASLASDKSAALPRWRGRRSLIALQVAVSVGLFLIATVMFREMRGEHREAGPDLDGIATATVPFNLQQRDAERVRRTVDGVLAEMREARGVEAIAATTLYQSLAGTTVSLTTPEGTIASAEKKDPPVAEFVIGTAGLFKTLGVPIQSGRAFDARDVNGGPPVVIVNETLARSIFGTTNVAGRQALMKFTMIRNGLVDTRKVPAELVTIAGVVPDRMPKGSGPDEAIVYAPFSQREAFDLAFIARASSGGAADLGSTLRAAIRRVDPEIAVSFAGRLDIMVGGPAAALGMVVTVAGSLASLALLLSMAGLYGVLSHVMSHRTREMGLRVALGAARRDIMRIVFLDGLRPVAEGVCIGIAAAIVVQGAVQSMSSHLPGTTPTSSINVVVCLLAMTPLLVAALAACYLPACRAAKVDPNVTLRDL